MAESAQQTSDPTRSWVGQARPGEPARNPTGRNQYTNNARRKFEKAIDEIVAGDLTPELLALIPDHLRPLFQGLPAISTAEAMALTTVGDALAGDDRVRAAAIERLWPKTEKHEHSGPDGRPVEIARAGGWNAVSRGMARVVERTRNPRDDSEAPGG